MAEFFENIGGTVSNFFGDTIVDGLQSILYATIYKLLYYIAIGCCWLIDLLYGMFEVMAGLSKVSYNGDTDYLINVFFSNTTVSKIYWGMALIGIVVGFGVTIAAVIKRLFDTREKEKRTYGQILSGLFKAILIIICMSLIIAVVLNATTLLMQQINYVFINAEDMNKDTSITYTDEQFATMARVLNTIGNYSLNPSYNNRFNLNKCFNEIRPDMQYLMQQGVFDFHYNVTDLEGNSIATWQSALQRIANSASLNRDLRLDVYHESVANALLDTMDLLRTNGSFKPLEEFSRQYTPTRNSVPLDRVLFLMATMRAAKNSDYNTSPSLTDALRGAYYTGEKSIYNLDQVNQDFDIGIAALDYVILFLASWKLLKTLVTIILNCVSRIFNMLLLYLVAPLIIGVSPLDDGAKFKQWTTAFVVQSFSVFGTVISMRVLMLFMPLITDTQLVLFSNPIANLLGKLVILLGGFEVVEKATNLITGILADNAGWQSITAGDMSGVSSKVTEMGKGAAGSVLKFGGKAVAGAAVGTVAGAGLLGMGVGYGAYGAVKGTIVTGKALANKISAWREQRAKAAGAADNGAAPGGAGGAGGAAGGAGDAGGAGGAGGAPAEDVPQRQGQDNSLAAKPYQQSSKIASMAKMYDEHIAGGAGGGANNGQERPPKQVPNSLRRNGDG